jgi:hypothetical protein
MNVQFMYNSLFLVNNFIFVFLLLFFIFDLIPLYYILFILYICLQPLNAAQGPAAFVKTGVRP